jgi:adenylate cyclase
VQDLGLRIKTAFNKLGQRRRRRIQHSLILLAAGGLFALMLATVQPFHTLNLWTADQFLGGDSPPANIVVVGIDDASLKAYGKWSDWSRSLHAQAVDNLHQAGASVIAFDVLFADSTPADSAFAAAMGRSQNTVLAMAGAGQAHLNNGLIDFPDWVIPADALLNSAQNVGHVDVVPDSDGKVRRIPLVIGQRGGAQYPSLSLAALFTLFHQPIPTEYALDNNNLNLLSRQIPVESGDYLRLNYSENPKSLPYLSYADVIKGDFDPALVKNKIVLIGMTATGDLDTWSIPNSALRVPGVFIHAAAMDTILRTHFLSLAGIGTTSLFMGILVVLCAMALPFFGTRYWKDLLRGIALVGLLLIINVVVASISANRGSILNVLYPSLLLIVLFVANILYIVVREQADKQFVKTLFGRYVSPEISKEIINLADGGRLQLGGEEREVSILFADIRNFTTLSQKMNPEGVVKMLNTCLPIMIDCIVANGGLVNKFAGDNLMGIWNAPKSQSGHPRLAVKAAWEAQRKMDSFGGDNPQLSSVRFGVGINTGCALAGNVGSPGRAEYTVIGDAVNLASRLCSSAPAGEILIGDATFQAAGSSLQTESLEPQLFKGMSSPVPVYRVVGLKLASPGPAPKSS